MRISKSETPDLDFGHMQNPLPHQNNFSLVRIVRQVTALTNEALTWSITCCVSRFYIVVASASHWLDCALVYHFTRVLYALSCQLTIAKQTRIFGKA